MAKGGKSSGLSGAKSAAKSGGGVNNQRASASAPIKKFSSKEIDKMSRKQLEQNARNLFIKTNMKSGLSEAEAARRFDALVDGNSTAQLKKYIKKHQ